MSKKNSSVSLKNDFKISEDLSKLYSDFKNSLINLKKKKFVVAVSGGPDSLALTALTKAVNSEKKLRFFYVLVNHNIRKNSFLEANKIKRLLKKNQIHLNILNNKSQIKKNIQSEARKIRYDLLIKFCKKKKTKVLMTAHHLDDQVETFFIRLSRGSGLTGLSAMQKLTKLNGEILLLRPLLNVQKKNLIKISKMAFGGFIQDPSNKNVKFLRTRVRGLKRPLNKIGITYEQIIKSINNLSSSKETLDHYYTKISNELILKKNNQITINLTTFKTLKSDIKYRLINDSIKRLKNNYYNPRSKKTQNLIKSIESKNFKKSTLAGCIFLKNMDILTLKVEKK